jgi:hypothetical protein
MITTHKNNLISRCKERGYSLEEVMGSVVKQDGDIWTIDENHPSYPKNSKTNTQPQNTKEVDIGQGAGTELKKLLKLIGITASPTCGCNAKAKAMNENGLEWCKSNMDTIVEWLKEEATKRNLPFFSYGAKKLVKFAINRAEKNANII